MSADALVSACRDPSDGIRAMSLLLPLLVRSEAVEPAEASAVLGCAPADLEAALDRLSFRVERDEGGAIVGAGITSIPTAHRFRVAGKTRYVWCALDTVLFPSMLGTSAEIDSVCAVTGEPIHFRALPGSVENSSPASIHVILVPPASGCADLRTTFCNEVVFAKDAAHAARCVSVKSGAWAMPLADAAQLAMRMAAAAGD